MRTLDSWIGTPLRTAISILVPVGLLAGSAVACGHFHDQGARVRDGGGSPGKYAKVLRLDDGDAGYVAVDYGSDIAIWWKGPEDNRWSAATRIDGGDGRYLTWFTTRLAGSTVAIRAYYSTVEPSDDEIPGQEPAVNTSVFVICRPRTCTASDHYEQVAEPPCRRGSCTQSRPESKGVYQVSELSADGDQAFFGRTEQGYVVWDPEHGIHELRADGVPTGVQVGAPMLAADGTMRLVAGRPIANICELTLLTTTSPPMQVRP